MLDDVPENPVVAGDGVERRGGIDTRRRMWTPFVPSTASTNGTMHVSGMEAEEYCCGNATVMTIAATATETRRDFLNTKVFPMYEVEAANAARR